MIMRDDEGAKAAFGGVGQELSRSQLDSSFTKESYWGIIALRFNDPAVRLHLNMVGNVDEVDSKLPPPVHRSATFLNDKFFENRSSFTVCWENWSKSGQNDNKDFKNFAGSRNGSLTEGGKRNMVLFVCARIGTVHEDTRFSSMCTRVIPFNKGCDEGGPEVPESDRQESQRQNGSPRRISRTARGSGKTSNMDENEIGRSIMEYSSFSINYKREKAKERREMAARKRRREAESQMSDELHQKSLLVKQMAVLHKQMVGSGLDPGKTYEDCAKQYMEELRDGFYKRQPTSGENQQPSSDGRDRDNVGEAARDSVGEARDEDEIQPNA